jgi:hypothetical protein
MGSSLDAISFARSMEVCRAARLAFPTPKARAHAIDRVLGYARQPFR